MTSNMVARMGSARPWSEAWDDDVAVMCALDGDVVMERVEVMIGSERETMRDTCVEMMNDDEG